jgi:peptidase E
MRGRIKIRNIYYGTMRVLEDMYICGGNTRQLMCSNKGKKLGRILEMERSG